MIDKNIVEYLNQYSKQYPIEALKEQLKNSGYLPQDIEDSLNYIQQGGLATPAGEAVLTPGKTWPWLRIVLAGGAIVVVTVTGYFIFRGFSRPEQASVGNKPAVSSGIKKEETKTVSTSQQGIECNPFAGQKVLSASADLDATYKDEGFPLFLDPAKGFPENKALSIDPLYSLGPSICAKHFENSSNEAMVSIILHDGDKAAARIIMLRAKAGTYNFSPEDYGDPGRLTLSIVDPDNPLKSPNLYFKSGSMTVGPNPLKPNEEMLINFRGLGGVLGIDGTTPVFRLDGIIKFNLPAKTQLEAPSFLPSCSSLGGELCSKDKVCDAVIASRDNNAVQVCCAKNFCGVKQLR
ncbi:MAG: hypothetical protein A3I24_00500 [Candidatus Harrisonbacteria bacterium RIFCSPLOWO2_02_FULL_41_13b]|uniref:Uncharacterized protein n=1 Tax=Candidatus Harrisonbacteria bacterium RIFCSPLOWO2_02_FULL_41_13b TaxID=1798409 RepID=A0A1G1ZSZ4_9BACT|nr:MAG: hypothetical protein A3J53_01235 [Candidatus Harrisonbacteria bacterium RIFCSPHIGHO2_02_FULL_40_20]OGY66947.1 MAG: hypothetical protein A3I24_00500 [Candidatus Harrisonbacteria bacterium RIFCSPLOWO2_02_FULL_41_13b]